MTTKIPALFFDGDGCGPTETELWVERHDPKRTELGDTLYFGLRVSAGLFGGERRDAGGFMLTPEQAAALYDQLVAVLKAR